MKSSIMEWEKFSSDQLLIGYLEMICWQSTTDMHLSLSPLDEGIFLYNCRWFRDNFDWDDVNEVRRRNCISRRPVAGDEISHTEAVLLTPNDNLFLRRNHHRGENKTCWCFVRQVVCGEPEITTRAYEIAKNHVRNSREAIDKLVDVLLTKP